MVNKVNNLARSSFVLRRLSSPKNDQRNVLEAGLPKKPSRFVESISHRKGSIPVI